MKQESNIWISCKWWCWC